MKAVLGGWEMGPSRIPWLEKGTGAHGYNLERIIPIGSNSIHPCENLHLSFCMPELKLLDCAFPQKT